MDIERRLSALEANYQHLERNFSGLQTEVRNGFEKLNASVQALLMTQSTAQALANGKKDGLKFGIHVLYWIIIALSSVVSFLFTLYHWAKGFNLPT